MAIKATTSLATIEGMLDDVEEYAHAVEALRRDLKRYKVGSPAYYDLLPDLCVQLDVLRLKVEHALEALDEYEDSLPEDE